MINGSVVGSVFGVLSVLAFVVVSFCVVDMLAFVVISFCVVDMVAVVVVCDICVVMGPVKKRCWMGLGQITSCYCGFEIIQFTIILLFRIRVHLFQVKKTYIVGTYT